MRIPRLRAIVRVCAFALCAPLACFWTCETAKDRDAAAKRDAFVREELQWRAEREHEMRSPTSWLTIAGLFWLAEGESAFGTDSSSAIRLPAGSAPSFAGAFVKRGDEVTLVPAPDAGITIGGAPIGETMLASDRKGNPSVVELGDLRMWLIERGERRAVRLRDLKAPAFTAFKALAFYPPREEYRIEGTLHRYPAPRTVVLGTMVGTEAAIVSPGYVAFRIGEEQLRLDVYDSGRDSTELFIVFKDQTSGVETYGACRFLEATVIDGERVELNFNRAYNPPCAYTPYATCPLPPPQNELPMRIEAGEMRYGAGH